MDDPMLIPLRCQGRTAQGLRGKSVKSTQADLSTQRHSYLHIGCAYWANKRSKFRLLVLNCCMLTVGTSGDARFPKHLLSETPASRTGGVICGAHQLTRLLIRTSSLLPATQRHRTCVPTYCGVTVSRCTAPRTVPRQRCSGFRISST